MSKKSIFVLLLIPIVLNNSVNGANKTISTDYSSTFCSAAGCSVLTKSLARKLHTHALHIGSATPSKVANILIKASNAALCTTIGAAAATDYHQKTIRNTSNALNGIVLIGVGANLGSILGRIAGSYIKSPLLAQQGVYTCTHTASLLGLMGGACGGAALCTKLGTVVIPKIGSRLEEELK